MTSYGNPRQEDKAPKEVSTHPKVIDSEVSNGGCSSDT
jgi:hypothetical protein